MLFKPNDIVIFFGDSITDCDRVKPAGEGTATSRSLGYGYVSLLQGCLEARHPELKLRVINKGTSGDRTRELLKRIDQDVISYKPNWVVLFIGINDVWRGFEMPNNRFEYTSNDDYKSNLDAIVHRIKSQGAQIILCSPYMIEPNKQDVMRSRMDEFGAICKETSEKYQLYYVDMQLAFDNILKDKTPYELAGDRIHPNGVGHSLIMLALANIIENGLPKSE